MPDAFSMTKRTGRWIRPGVFALALAGLLGFSRCSDLQDSPDAPNGPAAKVHPEGWANLQTGQFLHAQEISATGGAIAGCQGCHGEDFAGGIVESSCLECHSDPATGRIHPEGWLNRAVKESFHGHAVRSSGWDMTGCRTCHGEDYGGGSAAVSCLTCHADSPEGCTVCHGGGGGSAPPEDLQGNDDTAMAGVGAHEAHLAESAVSPALDCTECHVVPDVFDDPAHIDGDGRAEIAWGEAAQAGDGEPFYDLEAHTCADTYCHSGGKFGDNPTQQWTDVGTGQGDCGTCHGLPPAGESPDGATHVAVGPDTCSNCHPNVVDEENAIADKTRHLDGETSF